MYCPSCGSDERQLSQFCRVCGTDLRSVRMTLEKTDSVTASAVSARQQISLAIADRIRQVQSGKDLEHIAEEVLPQLEKFLESPEERRLRRVRAGLITAAIGLGATIGTFLLAVSQGSDFLPIIVPALVFFLIGIGVVINGFWFTVPRKRLPTDDLKSLVEESVDFSARPITKNIEQQYQSTTTPSVTEHTTHHLGTKDVR